MKNWMIIIAIGAIAAFSIISCAGEDENPQAGLCVQACIKAADCFNEAPGGGKDQKACQFRCDDPLLSVNAELAACIVNNNCNEIQEACFEL